MVLSVIITHHKTPEFLKLCLRYAKDALKDIGHEIIVVDSERTETTEMLMREDFADVRYISFQENVGYAKLVNRGMREARGKYFFIINADVILNQNAVSHLLSFMNNHPRIGIAGPRILNFNGTPQYSCFRYYTPFTILARRTLLGKTGWGRREIARFLMKDKPEVESGKPEAALAVDWIMGSALLVRRSAAEKVGPLDERFFMYFEDVDWCRRFWHNGYQVVYIPAAEIFHYHHRASKKRGGIFEILFNRQTRIHFISAVKYFAKYGITVPPAHPPLKHEESFVIHA